MQSSSPKILGNGYSGAKFLGKKRYHAKKINVKGKGEKCLKKKYLKD
jgi:hypothetical protein